MADGTAAEPQKPQEPRLRTRIEGLDAMLFGGIPTHNQVVVAGGPGAGKTLLCFNILYNTAKAGIPSVFISFDERPEDIIKNAKEAFSAFTDIDSLIQSGMLSISEEKLTQNLNAASFGKILLDIEQFVKSKNAKCVTLDSISLLKFVIVEGKGDAYRSAIIDLMERLKSMDVTALITIEMPTLERSNEKFTSEFFVFDGIISMYQSETAGRREMNMEVVKMRGTNHVMAFAPYEITESGMRIFALQEGTV